MKRLSIVITNYNYERYVAEAIESALAVRWPDVEVVVVDDGSTDNSLEVISRFEGRVRVIATANSRQRQAANRGYAESTGDAVIFLDSDDVLPPDTAEHLARALTDTVSKVQFRMQRVDASGSRVGTPFPLYEPVPTAGDIRSWFTRTSAYPTPPGSGNAYSRWFLDRIMPLSPAVGDFADSACLAAAPLLGDVVTVPEVVVSYRQHGDNDSNLLADPSRFGREVARAEARWRYACQVSGREADSQALFRSRELLQLRAVALRLGGSLKLTGDSRRRMTVDALRAPWQPGPESTGKRMLVTVLALTVLYAPRQLLHRVLRARYRAAR